MPKLIVILTFLFCLMGQAQAQESHPFVNAFQKALQFGELKLVEPLLDAEVHFRLGGASQSLTHKDVLLALTNLMGELRPKRCEVRHQGESANGQLYAMGRLEGNEGVGYSWLVRARPGHENSFKIFQLELDPD